MSIKSDRDLAQLQTIGRIVRNALDSMAAAFRPGVTTAELNEIGSRVLTSEGARSALAEGDLVTLDFVALIRGAESAFGAGAKTKAGRAGARVYDIGLAVECDVKSRGFSVLRELCGHGVRRTISAGDGTFALQSDNWTIVTRDRSLAARYEHTIVITRRAPILLAVAV